MSTETNKDEEYIEGPISIDLQYAVEDRSNLPSIDSLLKYATAAITGFRPEAEITIRIVEPDESHQLNLEYRGKDRPTNVLSFPATEDDDVFFFDDEDDFFAWWDDAFIHSAIKLAPQPDHRAPLVTLCTCSYSQWQDERTLIYLMSS